MNPLRLLRDRRGAMMALGATLFAALAVSGALLADLSRAHLVRLRLQAAVDAAALAAARELASGTTPAAAMAERVFDANAHASLWDAAPEPLSVAFPGGGAGVEVAAEARLPLALGRLSEAVAPDRARLRAAATAELATPPTELALVLDASSSMHGSKMRALQAAATSLLQGLYGGETSIPGFAAAITPFASTVNIGQGRTRWVVGAPAEWSGCVLPRDGALAETDESPARGLFPPFLSPSGEVSGKKAGKFCPDPILPLTASRAALQAAVDALEARPREGVHVQSGMVWGWRTLSPRWRGLWTGGPDGASPLAPREPDALAAPKVLVLVTEGQNLISGREFAPGQVAAKIDEAAVETSFLRVCEAIKADGIVVFTITVGGAAKNRNRRAALEACASDPEAERRMIGPKHFVAGTQEALAAALGGVADQLRQPRLVR